MLTNSQPNAHHETLRRANYYARRHEAIKDAINRFRDGTYGVCWECQGDIPLERLEAIPWAALCTRCQEIIGKRIRRG